MLGLQDRLSHSYETIGAARHIFLTLCQPISSVTAYEVSEALHEAIIIFVTMINNNHPKI